MKTRVLIALALITAVLTVLWLTRPEGLELTPSKPSAAPRTDPAGEPLAAAGQDYRQVAASSGITLLPEIRDIALKLNGPDNTGQEDIDILNQLLEEYRRVNNGRNPVGLNFEIVEALKGANAKKYAVFPADLPHINAEGDLLDRWGTPYFFHNLTPEILEIQSAGADQKFGSEDDIGQVTQL